MSVHVEKEHRGGQPRLFFNVKTASLEGEVRLMAKGKYEYWLTPDGLLLLEAWARDGLTDEQIAHNLNITPSTYYEWKKKYPEISEAIKRGGVLPPHQRRLHPVHF